MCVHSWTLWNYDPKPPNVQVGFKLWNLIMLISGISSGGLWIFRFWSFLLDHQIRNVPSSPAESWDLPIFARIQELHIWDWDSL